MIRPPVEAIRAAWRLGAVVHCGRTMGNNAGAFEVCRRPLTHFHYAASAVLGFECPLHGVVPWVEVFL